MVTVNTGFLKSPNGLLRLLEILLAILLCFLAGLYSNCWTFKFDEWKRILVPSEADCDSIFAYPFDGRYWGAMLVVILAIITIIISSISFIIRFFDGSLDPKSEIVYTACCALNFVVATGVMAWVTDAHFKNGPIQYLYGQGIAASVVCAVIAVLYALDCLLLYRRYGGLAFGSSPLKHLERLHHSCGEYCDGSWLHRRLLASFQPPQLHRPGLHCWRLHRRLSRSSHSRRLGSAGE